MARELSLAATAARRMGADAAADGTLHRRAEETVERSIRIIEKAGNAL
jgi:hypothetical protein